MSHDATFKAGPLAFELGARSVTLETSEGVVALRLTRLEHDLLVMLARAGGSAVSRATLFDALWGRDSEVTEHAMNEAISTLRRRLGEGRWLVETVRGVGYRLAPERAPRAQRRTLGGAV